MVTLEAQPVRRDDAVKLMQRREIDRGNRIGGQPWHIAAHDIGFKLRRLSIGRNIDAFAEIAVPVLDFGDQRIARPAPHRRWPPQPRRQAARP
jgi:hypothetical protein